VENLRIFARYHLLSRAAREARIAEILDFLDLRAFADVPVARLSGGFKRRLSIGLSLVSRPELLILDEPTTGLDPAVRLALWQRVRELRDAGTTVLLTTHYMDEAERLCDRIAVLAAGRVVADGAPARLVREALAAEALELGVAPRDEALLLGALDAGPRARGGGPGPGGPGGARRGARAGPGAPPPSRPSSPTCPGRPARPATRGRGRRERPPPPHARRLAPQLRDVPAHLEAQPAAELLR